MPRDKTISIDFDGVIHDYSKGWYNGTIYGPPTPGAQESIRRLINKGYHVVILTARAHSPEQIRAIHVWLESHGFPVGLEVTNVKPPAIAYIDDRAIRFTNWADISNYF